MSVFPQRYLKRILGTGYLACVLVGSVISPLSAWAAEPIVMQFQVSENDSITSGNANNYTSYNYTITGTPTLSTASNRADWIFLQDGKKLTSADYVCFAATADGFRTHAINPSDFAVTGVYINSSSDWVVSTVRASDTVAEIPNNFSALYIPKTSTIKTGMTLTAANAVNELKTYFAEGDFSPMDGTLIACAGLTTSNADKNFGWNPHYNIYSSLDTANNGFIINASNTDGATTTDSKYTLNYAFIPHGTEGTVTGSAVARQISGVNCILPYGGSGYSLEYIRAGEYKLTLDNYKASDGILMINGMTAAYNNNTAGDYSHDNIFTVTLTDDQQSFIIKSLDMNNNRVFTENHELQNGAFSFAFISYDSTLETPETGLYRTEFDPGGKDYAGSRIDVTVHKVSSAFTDRNLHTNEMTSPYISVSTNNTGDFHLFTNGKDFSNSNGIFITTTAQNDTRIIPQVFIDGEHAAISTVDFSGEKDSSVSFGYFPVSSSQWVANSVTENGTLTKRSSAAASLTTLSNGVQTYTIDGVDSRTDGILLATGRTNNARYLISAAPQDDGSWNLNTYEAHTNNSVTGAYDLLFLPYGNETGFISGWIDGETGESNSSFGYFGIEKQSEGVFELTMGDGLTSEDGFLLLGLAGDAEGNPFHGMISYDVTEDETFLINIRDLDVGNALADADFMFAFFSTSGSLQNQVPEPAAWTLFVLGACTLAVIRARKKVSA